MLKMILLMLGSLLCLTACSHSPHVDKRQLESAIAEHLARQGEQCLTDLRWPQDFSAEEVRDGFSPIDEGAYTQVMALKHAGMVTEQSLAISVAPPPGQHHAPPHITLRFALSKAAIPFIRANHPATDPEAPQQRVALCWGKIRLHKVVRWEEETSDDKVTRLRVYYLYRLEDVAPWAQDSEIRAHYLSIAEIQDGAERAQRHLTVQPAEQGWQVVPDNPYR